MLVNIYFHPAKAETPVLWPPHVKSWLIGKDSDAGRDWGQEEKGTREDEMAGWHHWLHGRESGWTPGVGDGQGSRVCCSSWCHKEPDTTERLNWTELKLLLLWLLLLLLVFLCLIVISFLVTHTHSCLTSKSPQILIFSWRYYHAVIQVSENTYLSKLPLECIPTSIFAFQSDSHRKGLSLVWQFSWQ